MQITKDHQSQLIIVSNRLPVSVKSTDEGFEVYPSVGGLATGLASYAGRQNRWIGWPGLPSDDLSVADKAMITAKLARLGCYPVWLTKKEIDEFYNGYSNSVLWPTMHELSFGGKVDKSWWPAYQAVNQKITEATLELSQASSPIWVHDYQLMLMPGLLRAARPEAKIGFFLHIPFPSQKFFLNLKESNTLINGVLGANLVGVHTSQYAENIREVAELSSVGTRSSHHTIAMPSHVARVDEFPMGIDYTKFSKAIKEKTVRREFAKLKSTYKGKKVILSVDRLDPTKGLYERLKAYQSLLKRQPELRENIEFVMLAVPSRTEIPEYKKLRTKVESLVKQINQEYGTPSWKPVNYIFDSLPFEKVSALYQRADVAFIAPIKDGMNLVAKEYLASRNNGGALILSTSAGAADELTDAIMVDPSKPETMVEGLHQALNMSQAETKQRLNRMQLHLKSSTVDTWAQRFISVMKQPFAIPLTPSKSKEIAQALKQSSSPIILLDYDGTLRPFVDNPDKATPSEDLLLLLDSLAKKADVSIVSGRSSTDLAEWFNKTPVGLVAEHGSLHLPKGAKKWRTLVKGDREWIKPVSEIMERYSRKIPGSHVEHKKWALVWHYRMAASQSQAQKALSQLRRELNELPYDIAIKDGSKILEVTPAGINKGAIVQRLVKKHDFVLIAGDDTTDEDMFKQAPKSAYTIKVGSGNTAAKLRVASSRSLIKLLNSLIDTTE